MPRNMAHHKDSILIFSEGSHAANQLAQQFREKGYRTFIQSSPTETAHWRIERLALVVLLNCKDVCASFQHYLSQIKRDSSNLPIVCVSDTIPLPMPAIVDLLADSSHPDRRHASHAANHKQLNQVQSKNLPASLIPAPPWKASHTPIRLLIISKSRRLIETVQASCRHDPADQIDIAWLADLLPAPGPPTQPQPDLILLDAVTPECRMTCLLQAASNQYPAAKIILLENPSTSGLVHHIVEFKIRGLLPRDANPEVYRKALQVVHNGELWLPHLVISQVFAFFSEEYRLTHQTTANAPALTARELAIAALVAEGCTNKEAAKRLNLSPETIKKHLKNIFTKLDTHTRSELASMYMAMVSQTLQRLT